MPTLEKWTDFSKWQGPVGATELGRMKADNVAGVWPGAWHGIDANRHAAATLATAAAMGMKKGCYTIINDRPGAWSVQRAFGAVGNANWDRLRFVAIDVELRFSAGVDGERIIRDAAAETVRLGQRPVLYTGNWFWNWWALSMGHFPDVGGLPVIVAFYNGVPDLTSFPTRPGYGPIVGHQYTGSTQAYGTTVDFNVLDQAWVDARIAPPAPPPPTPTPEPPAEEGDIDMGKILDAAVVAGNAIVRGAELTEAEIAKAMKLPVAPTPAPAPTPTPSPTPAPAPTGTRYTVVGGDNLGTIALKYQSKWPRDLALWGRDGAVAVLAAHNGIDPNAGLSVGQVLKIPW